MKLLSDQQYFTSLLTLCMPFWQVLLFLHMIKETEDKGRRINEQQQQLLFCQSRGPKAAEQLQLELK
jgi:hypothetical protein